MSRNGILILTTMLMSFFFLGAHADEAQKPPEIKAPTVKSRGTKATWSATVVRQSVPPDNIPQLILAETNLGVTLVPKNGKLRPSVEMRGSFDHPGWSLSVDRTLLLPPQKTGKQIFSVVAYLNGRLNEIIWTARGPNGEVVTEPIILLAPEAQEFRIVPQWGELLFFTGYTTLSYYQTQLDYFHSSSILLGAEYTTLKGKSKYGLMASAETNLFSLSATPPQYRPLHLNVKADVTYDLQRNSPGRLKITPLLGVSYSTMFSNGSPFGFSNLAAVEVGARGYYELKQNAGLIGDLRYIPLSGIVSFAQAEVDLTFGWTKVLENYHRVQIDLRYSNLAYKPNEPTVIRNHIISLRIGYNI